MRAILTYHSIDASRSAISVDEASFRRHVKWLASGGVSVVSVDELLLLPPSSNAVGLTFDDGFVNFSTIAAPILRDHGLPVTVFVVSDRVGATNDWGQSGAADPHIPNLPLMGWEALGRLMESGVQLGAHSRAHRDLVNVRGAALQDEVTGAADTIEAHTGRRPSGFAYPYGSVDATVSAAVAGAYRWACTTELRGLKAGDSLHLLPRLDAYYLRAQGVLESWGSARFRHYLWFRSQARRVRQGVAAARGLA